MGHHTTTSDSGRNKAFPGIPDDTGTGGPREEEVLELETKLESLRNEDRGASPTGGAELDIVDEIQDLPMPTLADVIQLMLTLWQYGLEDSVPFRVQINRIKDLLVEKAARAEGDGEVKRSTLEEPANTGSDDGGWRWQGANNDTDAESVQIRIEPDSEGEVCSSSYPAQEGSDVSSIISSLYTVKSVTSINERTNWFWPPREKRDKVVPEDVGTRVHVVAASP